MSERLLFPGLKLFKKEVTERFLVVTREIYKNHPTYTYSDNEEESNIFIFPSYANTESDGKQPRIISRAGSYNYGLMDTMNNNMSKEVVREGSIVGYEHSQIITIPITFLIHAYAEEESSDIADEFAGLVVYACRKMYSQAGLVIRGMQISETDVFKQDQDLYQTTATVSIDVPWNASTVDKGPPIGEVEFETEAPLHFNTYRSPGVTVFTEKKDDIS